MPTVEQVMKDPDFAGLDNTEKIKVLRTIDPDFANLPEPEQNKVAMRFDDLWGGSKAEIRTPPPGTGTKEFIREYVTPTLQMGGLAAGGAAGLPAAIPTLGLAPVATAGAGYALGTEFGGLAEQAVDAYYGRKAPSEGAGKGLIRGAENVAEGMTYQMLGEALGPAIFTPLKKAGKWVFNVGKTLLGAESTEQATKRAADMWVANTSQGPIYTKNRVEAEALEESIPGLKFTYGQRTYDPKEIKVERAQFKKPGEAGASSVEQIASNDEALKAYYSKNFGSDKGVDDLLSALQGKRTELEGGIETAKGTAKTVEAGLSQSREPIELSKQLVEIAKKEKGIVKESVSNLYGDVGNPDVPVTDLMLSLKGINVPTSQVESAGNFPSVLRKALKEYGPKEMPEELRSLMEAYAKAGKPIPSQIEAELAKYSEAPILPFQELRGLRTEILNEARAEAGKTGANPAKLKRLADMQVAVEKSINQLSNSGQFGEETATKYRVASEQWRKYNEKFKQGTVGDILRPGPRGEASKLTSEEMLGAIFDKGNVAAADQLISAVGKSEATAIATEYANYDLMRKTVNPISGEVDRGRLMRWFSGNKPILKKYGLEGNYDDLVKAKQVVDEAIKTSKEFEKSQAAKALGADPEKVISTVFSGKGSRNSAQTMKDVLEIVGSNDAAKQGLKQSFADMAMKQTSDEIGKIFTSAKDIMGNPAGSVAKFQQLYQKYAPAIRVLYADEPEKISTLLNIKKAFEISIRNKVSPLGGGSDTAENLAQMLSTLAGPLARTSRSATAIRSIARRFTEHETKMIDDVLVRAIFDPEYADALTLLSKNTYFPEVEAKFAKIFPSIIAETKRNTTKSQE